MFAVYVTAGFDVTPASTNATVHGVIAAPVYTKVVPVHVIVAVGVALAILKVTVADDAAWFASPAKA